MLAFLCLEFAIKTEVQSALGAIQVWCVLLKVKERI